MKKLLLSAFASLALFSAGAWADKVSEVFECELEKGMTIANAQAIVSRTEQERLRLEKVFLEVRNEELARINADKARFFSILSSLASVTSKNPLETKY